MFTEVRKSLGRRETIPDQVDSIEIFFTRKLFSAFRPKWHKDTFCFVNGKQVGIETFIASE